MEDLVIGKQHPNVYKSPRRKNTIPSEFIPDNRHNDENTQRKFGYSGPDADFAQLKSGQIGVKNSMKDNNIFMSSAIKSITPKVLRNLANRSQAQEPLIKKGKFQMLPQVTNEERNRQFLSPDAHRGYLDETDRGYEINQYRETEERGVETQRRENDLHRIMKPSYKQKLPTINDRKVMLFIEEKKLNKRTGQENKVYSIAMGKGEIDMPVPSTNISIRANSISPIKEPKSAYKSAVGLQGSEQRHERGIRREEKEERSDGKSYSEDKVKMYSIYKGGYADGSVDRPDDIQSVINMMKKSPVKAGGAFVKIVNQNVSAGEDEENTESLSVSLTIAPLRGSQRTVKQQIKKKAEGLKVSSTLEIAGYSSSKMKKEADKKKKKEEDKSAASSLTNFTRGEKKKKKEVKEAASPKAEGENNELEGWNKNESDLNISKGDVDDEDEEKEHEQEQESEEKEDSEKPSNGKAAIEKNKERVIVAALKKSGVMIPVNSSTTTKNEVVSRVPKKAADSKFGDKEKDLTNAKREQAYKEFMFKMNFSFNVSVKVPVEKTFTAYKYFLGKGNNSIMLKSMMKTRWWWVQTDNKEGSDVNFMWTQLKQNKFIDGLKQRRKTPFENLESSALSSNVNDATTANSLNTLDSVTDCESDTTESETCKSATVKKKPTGKKLGRKNSKKKTGEPAHLIKSQEDAVQSAYKKLFTGSEIMLINSLSNHKGTLYREDFEELGKLRKGPATQVVQDPSTAKMCNHLESNFHLANKKALLWNMRSYYEATKENVFDYLPLTFHVRNGFEDKEYQKFLEYYNNREQEIQEQEKMLAENKEAKKNVKKLRNLWIVKPGENTNRGVGIHVCNELSQINELVATTEGNTNGRKRTYLIQQYLDRPFLYNKRKFDIRCYILVSCVNNTMKGYWYQEGYIRTATREFSLKNVTNKLIHLTNDAVQKKAEDYGKFEAGNKLSYNDFQKYLDTNYNGTVNFYNDMYPQIKKLATDCIKGVYGKMDPYRRENCFEVFGLDFMIDQNLKAWLIEVNTNPDINASSPTLTRVIPPMVENALRLTIDQMYPPPAWQMNKKLSLPENLLENNKFELVFDEVEDGPALRNILSADKGATGDLILEIVAEEEEETEEEAN